MMFTYTTKPHNGDAQWCDHNFFVIIILHSILFKLKADEWKNEIMKESNSTNFEWWLQIRFNVIWSWFKKYHSSRHKMKLDTKKSKKHTKNLFQKSQIYNQVSNLFQKSQTCWNLTHRKSTLPMIRDHTNIMRRRTELLPIKVPIIW